MFKERKIIKELKKLRVAPADKVFLARLKENLVEFMRFHPVRGPIKMPVLELSPLSIFGGMNLAKALSVFLIMAVVLGGAGAAWASEAALPGEPLYALKTFGEDTREKLTLNPQKKAELGLRLAEKRISEIEKIMAEKDYKFANVQIARERFRGHVRLASDIAEKEARLGKDGDFAALITNELHTKQVKAKQVFENEQDKIKTKRHKLDRELELVEERAKSALPDASLEASRAGKLRAKIDDLSLLEIEIKNSKQIITENFSAERKKIFDELGEKEIKIIEEKLERREEIDDIDVDSDDDGDDNNDIDAAMDAATDADLIDIDENIDATIGNVGHVDHGKALYDDIESEFDAIDIDDEEGM